MRQIAAVLCWAKLWGQLDSPQKILVPRNSNRSHVSSQNCFHPTSRQYGKIVTTLPIGSGVDGAVFNPATMEVLSSQRDGTLTVIKENSPTDFEVKQNAATKQGAKTRTLDSQKNQIFLITAEPAPPDPSQAPAQGVVDKDGCPILSRS